MLQKALEGVFVGAAVCGGGFLLIRYLLKDAQARDAVTREHFSRDVLNRSAQWIATKLHLPADQICDELVAWSRGGAQPPSLQAVVRIECHLRKKAHAHVHRRIVVVLQNDTGTLKLAQIDDIVPWEQLPESVRGCFIRNATQPVVLLLVDCGDSTAMVSTPDFADFASGRFEEMSRSPAAARDPSPVR